jgi:hypothetical protein
MIRQPDLAVCNFRFTLLYFRFTLLYFRFTLLIVYKMDSMVLFGLIAQMYIDRAQPLEELNLDVLVRCLWCLCCLWCLWCLWCSGFTCTVQVPEQFRTPQKKTAFTWLSFNHLNSPGSIGDERFAAERGAIFDVFMDNISCSTTPDSDDVLQAKFDAVVKRACNGGLKMELDAAKRLQQVALLIRVSFLSMLRHQPVHDGYGEFPFDAASSTCT